MIEALKTSTNLVAKREYAQEYFNHLTMSQKYLTYYEVVLNGKTLHDHEPAVTENPPYNFHLTE